MAIEVSSSQTYIGHTEFLVRCLADAFGAQEGGIQALAAHVQRGLATALVTAAAALQPQAQAHGAVEQLLHSVIQELSALAGECTPYRNAVR